MNFEISAKLDELLDKIKETAESLSELDDPAKLIVLGVVLSRTIKGLDEDVDEGEIITFLMQKSEQIVKAIENLQIEGVDLTPRIGGDGPKVWS